MRHLKDIEFNDIKELIIEQFCLMEKSENRLYFRLNQTMFTEKLVLEIFEETD